MIKFKERKMLNIIGKNMIRKQLVLEKENNELKFNNKIVEELRIEQLNINEESINLIRENKNQLKFNFDQIELEMAS